jgi:hypothetical protein
MPSVTTQWRVLQGQQSSGCVVGYRPAGMVELHRWGCGGVVQLKLKASTTRRAYRSASVILDNYTTRGRGTLPVEHRLAVLEISQNHEAGGRGRQVFEGMCT